jgi:hypothetical protein
VLGIMAFATSVWMLRRVPTTVAGDTE